MVAIGPQDDVERIVLSAIQGRTRPKQQAAASSMALSILATALGVTLVIVTFVLLHAVLSEWRDSQDLDRMLKFHQALSAAK